MVWRHVLHVLNTMENLISTGALQHAHITQIIDKNSSLYLQFKTRVFSQGVRCSDNLFALNLRVIQTLGPISLIMVSPILSFAEMHKWINHIGYDLLKWMVFAGLTGGLCMGPHKDFVCELCLEANLKRLHILLLQTSFPNFLWSYAACYAVWILNITPSSFLPNIVTAWTFFFKEELNISFYLLWGAPCLYKVTNVVSVPTLHHMPGMLVCLAMSPRLSTGCMTLKNTLLWKSRTLYFSILLMLTTLRGTMWLRVKLFNLKRGRMNHENLWGFKC